MRWWKRAPDTKTRVEPELPPAGTEDVAGWVMHLVPASPRLEEVVDTLRDLFAKVPTRDLFDLDTQIRRRTTWAWATLTPRDARRLVLRSGDSLTVGAAMSMHPNGHVREVGVRALGAIPDPRAFRWLVVRATDWVPAIRDRATESVLRATGTASPEGLVDALPLVLGRRFELGRRTHAIRAAMLAPLTSSEGREVLRTRTSDADPLIRRQAFSVLADVEPSIALLHEALAIGDVVAATTAARPILSAPDTGHEGICVLFVSRLAQMRATAVWEAHKHGGLTEVVDEALFDPSPTVRRLAQQVATRDRDALRSLYIDALDTQAGTAVALHGLADMATPDDAALAIEYLDDPYVRVRFAAVRLLVAATATTGRDTSTNDRLVVLALDASGRVAGEAIRGLRARGLSEPIVERLYLAATIADANVRRRIFRRVLLHTSRWQQLRYGLRALTARDTTLHDLGLEVVKYAVDSWNQSSTVPRAGELDEIQWSLDAARVGRSRRTDQLVARVADILGSYHPRTYPTAGAYPGA
ncbi:MAG: hypothetical protein JW940_03050 [Polyangiaceae bacterium]|nr:hypothetical protein [Polyangiaceae bacterium]